MEDIKRQQVYEILLTPIVCTKYSNRNVEIEREKNVINSTQTYYPCKKFHITLDEDMSDFSVGFYEIIYKELLNGNPIINNKNDGLFDRRFAGDTMNSFETIANLIPEAGDCKKNRTPCTKWPKFLQNYKMQYHCLANFWILPIEIGRMIDKNNEICKASYDFGIQDYMDIFLNKLKEKQIEIFTREPFNNFHDFAKVHFLIGSYVYNDTTVYKFSNGKLSGEMIIDRILDRIKLRATSIANSDFAESLWDYFNKLGLIQKI